MYLESKSMPSKTVAYPKEELEKRYHEITALYDIAEELVGTVESPLIQDAEQQLELVEALIEQVGETADLLSEQFIDIAENKYKATSSSKSRIESSLRKLYMAMDDYRRRVGATITKTTDKLHNIADPIVTKLKRQIERVIGIFVEFIDLSLHLVMNQTQLAQLRANEATVALAMHRMSQQH